LKCIFKETFCLEYGGPKLKTKKRSAIFLLNKTGCNILRDCCVVALLHESYGDGSMKHLQISKFGFLYFRLDSFEDKQD
jgi:hypothetical protein